MHSRYSLAALLLSSLVIATPLSSPEQEPVLERRKLNLSGLKTLFKVGKKAAPVIGTGVTVLTFVPEVIKLTKKKKKEQTPPPPPTPPPAAKDGGGEEEDDGETPPPPKKKYPKKSSKAPNEVENGQSLKEPDAVKSPKLLKR